MVVGLHPRGAIAGFAVFVATSAYGAKHQRPPASAGTLETGSSIIQTVTAASTAGCTSSAHVEKGEVFNRTLLWRERGLPPVKRLYSVYVPPSYRPGTPSGLVLVFHGWGDPSSEMSEGRGHWPQPYHNFYGYRKAADSSGFITIYPVGLSDCKGKDCFDHGTKMGYESWNGVGTTSSADGGKVICNKSITDSDYCYYSTAAKKGKCHSCDWTTGYNDVGFVRKLVHEIESSFCIDPKRIFATGCSNGGMFVHALAQRMSDTFAAVVANCAGKPHEGFERMPQGKPVSMMLVTGRDDTVIRGWHYSEGQKWWDGFKYASRQQVFEAYRVRNQCPPKMENKTYTVMRGQVPIGSAGGTFSQTSANAGAGGEEADYQRRMVCRQLYHDGCAGNSSLVSCEWRGGHDIMRGEPSTEYMFFAEHPRQ